MKCPNCGFDRKKYYDKKKNAGLTKDHLDSALATFEKLGKELKIL